MGEPGRGSRQRVKKDKGWRPGRAWHGVRAWKEAHAGGLLVVGEEAGRAGAPWAPGKVDATRCVQPRES